MASSHHVEFELSSSTASRGLDLVSCAGVLAEDNIITFIDLNVFLN